MATVRVKVKMPVSVRCKMVGNDAEQRQKVDNEL